MTVTEVKSKTDIKKFHRVPFTIYKDEKNWVPHLKQDVEKTFDPEKNKMFRQGEAIRWILENDGEVIGRIAAFVDRRYSKGMQQPTGGLGFFECVNDKEAAFKLLDTAVNWLKERGMEAVDGPINFGEKNQFWGLLRENFTSPPSYGMNYNPEYYVHFFEDYGFQIYYDQFVFHRDTRVPAQDVFVRKSSIIMQDKDYTVRDVRGQSMDEIARNFMTVYNNAWGGHHGFRPMKEIQAKKVMKALKPVMDRNIIIFAYFKEKPIAFYVNIPELNEIFCHVNGNLNWIGKLIFLYHKWKKTPNTMVGIVFGVDREYHGKGVEGAMITWAEDMIKRLNRYDQTILTWIGDFNPKMIRVAENLGCTLYRTLSTYRKLFDPEKPFSRAPKVG